MVCWMKAILSNHSRVFSVGWALGDCWLCCLHHQAKAPEKFWTRNTLLCFFCSQDVLIELSSWPGRRTTQLSRSPPRSVVSRGTCQPGSTSRTCSKASPPCSYPSTPSHPLRVWWSWSNSVGEPYPKLCGRRASASGSTAAEGQRAAGYCQSSGCSVRCSLF